ncbi:bifunctional triacylglycerol lipase/ester hydrolase [Sporobolomyces koalae]|uniref:bifunctional triacylglycerol lipase/ester hydrolase n=1 Tax=Sporobolomyces koalae TaxID=500713 RepID=UPI00317D12DE
MSSYLNKQAPPPPPPRASGSSATVAPPPPPTSSSSGGGTSAESPARTTTRPSHRHKQSVHYNDAPDLSAASPSSTTATGERTRPNRVSRVPALAAIPTSSPSASSTTNSVRPLDSNATILPAFNAPPAPPPDPIKHSRAGPRSLPFDVTQFPPSSITTKLVVVFVPGNPGLVEYYDPFLTALRDALPTEFKESTEMYSIGHLGHSLDAERDGKVTGFKPHEQATLEEQVDSKIEFVDQLASKYGKDVKIMIMGHSIGSWICLQMLKQRPNLISSAHLLFPTISSMSLTPNGRKLSPLFSSWTLRPLFYSTSFLSYLPTKVVNSLVGLLTGQTDASNQPSGSGSGAATTTTRLVSSPQTVIAAITMAQKEMQHVKDIDRELLSNRSLVGDICWWYWAEPGRDGWVLEDSIREIEEALGDDEDLRKRRERCREGMPHAFVLDRDHTLSLARKCAGWIVKDLEESRGN